VAEIITSKEIVIYFEKTVGDRTWTDTVHYHTAYPVEKIKPVVDRIKDVLISFDYKIIQCWIREVKTEDYLK